MTMGRSVSSVTRSSGLHRFGNPVTEAGKGTSISNRGGRVPRPLLGDCNDVDVSGSPRRDLSSLARRLTSVSASMRPWIAALNLLRRGPVRG